MQTRRRHEIGSTVIQLLGFSDIFDERPIFKNAVDIRINKLLKHEKLSDMKAIACLFDLHKRTYDKLKQDTTMKSKLGLVNSILGRSCLALKRRQVTIDNTPTVYYELEHINEIKQIMENKIIKKHEMGIDAKYHPFYSMSDDVEQGPSL